MGWPAKAFGMICMGALLAACADKPSVTAGDANANGPAAMTVVAAGVALPAGYKVDADRTLIFGTDEHWTGRVAYTTKSSADDVFDFLHKEMPNFGWTELTSMRSDVSLLTFTSEETSRVAVVRIGRGSMLGSTAVDLVVSPRENGAGAKTAAQIRTTPLPTK